MLCPMSMFALLPNLGGPDLIVLLLLVLVLFGAKKLPELAKGMGQGIREFKKASREVTEELESAADDTPPPRKLTAENKAPSESVSQSNSPKA